MCDLPDLFEMLSLGSIPSSFCPYFTLASACSRLNGAAAKRSGSGKSLRFLVYSEDTRHCLFETELVKSSARPRVRLETLSVKKSLPQNLGELDLMVLPEDSEYSEMELAVKMEVFLSILTRVHHLNRERTDTLGRVSVLCESVDTVASLSQKCGMKEVSTRSVHGLLRRDCPHVVSLLVNTPKAGGARGSSGRRRVNHLYSACEVVKEVQTYLETKPENLQRLVIHCSTLKEVKQYRRIIQSIFDHAFLINPETALTPVVP